MNQTVVVIGGGPLAMLLALSLSYRKIQVTWIDAPDVPDALFNPEMMLLGGDDELPGLFQQSLNRWRNATAEFHAPQMLLTQGAVDVATSLGRELKLKEEATLDALAGETVTYANTLPAWLARRYVRGVKLWPEAPQLLDNTIHLLRTALTQSNVLMYNMWPNGLDVSNPSAPVVRFENAPPITATHVVITGGKVAGQLLGGAGLKLPLRPARGHVLALTTPQPHGLPLVLVRLERGHLFVVPKSEREVEIHYDAVNDPLQSTLSKSPNPQLVKALQQHIGTLIPVLAGAPLTAVHTVTHWVTPDFLPALGVWQGIPGLLLGVGWGGRSVAFAAAAASVLEADILADTATNAVNGALSPSRFAGGTWQPAKAPGSLVWSEPAAPMPSIAITEAADPTYMSNVNMVDAPTAQYASNVNQVEKTIISAQRAEPVAQERSKPKIQTAAIRNK